MRLLPLILLSLCVIGCDEDENVPAQSEAVEELPAPQPARSTEILRSIDEVQCLTLDTEVNVIDARGNRRVEPAGVSFLTNSGVARIESAGRVLYENVRIIDGCGDPEPESASDVTIDVEPSDEDLEVGEAAVVESSAAVLPIPGGGAISTQALPASSVSTVGSAAGGGGSFGSAAIGGAGAAGGAFGGRTVSPSIQAADDNMPPIASPSIPGN